MYIKFIEIANFRKLLSVRVDLSETTTLFVGANNSGKTSAMIALRKFLTPHGRQFETCDFTLCHWSTIDAIGQSWIDARTNQSLVDFNIADWADLVPTLDLWFHVEPNELHYVKSIIPTLEWAGGQLGVRLRFEPKDLPSLYKEFLAAVDSAQAIHAAAINPNPFADQSKQAKPLTVWPTSLVDFLDRRLSHFFEIRAYILDPSDVRAPQNSQARRQALPADAVPIDGDPLKGLVRVNDIPAQRGFGEGQSPDGKDGNNGSSGTRRLSEQLRAYYAKHLDPTNSPDPSDIGALQAIEAAQDAFNARLKESFTAAFSEVEGMGYPGVTDPRPHVSTRLKAIDGLNHSAAVTFEVDVVDETGKAKPILRLPEDNNGLGYQNLISMIFRLLSFRDGWMRVGKASKASQSSDALHIEPLHLVLVEEPEAHLHAQVQQVFIKKAYAVLREHDNLRADTKLRTQLVVSTHSSHVAHETGFSCLRYFRRLPAGMVAQIPVSAVVNLSTTFGSEKETERFVTRYLRAQHADLFFADAAILVEGPAERMLVPNFIRLHYEDLNQCYISLLEIGGSHAHRLRPLLQELCLTTLIVTDLDSLDSGTSKSVQPAPNSAQITNNTTLKDWIPQLSDIDALWSATTDKKIVEHDPLFQVRVAYQTPIKALVPSTKKEEDAFPYTFEDALAFENLEFFSQLGGSGLVKKFREAIQHEKSMDAIGQKLYEALKEGKKAEFALDVLDAENFASLTVPLYIAQGLEWLQEHLRKKQAEILPRQTKAEAK